MLLITERKTAQKNLTDGSILHMVSLFVVAYPQEVEKFEEDNFETFLKDARSKGHMLLPEVAHSIETVEVSKTRKGFLIKASVTDFLSVESTAAGNAADEEVFKVVLGYPNYELSNWGNLRNVNTGKVLDSSGGYKLYKDGVATRMSHSKVVELVG